MPSKDKYDWDNIPLGKLSDAKLSKLYDIPRPTVTKARVTRKIPPHITESHERFDWDSLPLGELPDAEIARKYGLVSNSVGQARRRRGIPAFVEEGKAPPARAQRGIDWDEQPLGKVPDRILQKRLGLASQSSVSRARKYRGIKHYTPPPPKEMVNMYFELKFKWDDLEAVEARYKELVEKAQGKDAS